MPKPSATSTKKRKPTKPTKRAPNYELIDARRTAREQREIVKRTRALRRDLATHRRELRMLWMDLTRMFTGKFPDELAALSGEPSPAAYHDDSSDRYEEAAAPVNVVREHARV